MKNKTSIQIKAAFLLVVFALNTLVGFACSLGVDMGFNTRHHHDEETAVIHIHKDGKKHVHHAKTGHQHNKSHHHDLAIDNKSKEDSDKCCHGKVIKFEQQDKSVAKAIEYNCPLFSASIIAESYYPDLLYCTVFVSKIKYFVRGHHPPIPDIRIAIRSFQI